MPRFFTLEEATALLPRLNSLLDDLVLLRDAILARRPEIRAALEKSVTNGGNRPAGLAVADWARFERILGELRGLGVLLKDLDMGLLDFPSIRDGREVYLCWRKGEERIAYWHEVDTGYAGRIPL